MNKLGSASFVMLMLGIVFFVLGLALAPALKEITSEAMGTDYMNCTNSSISQQTKAICTQIDIFQPLFIGLLFGLAGLLIGGIAIR